MIRAVVDLFPGVLQNRSPLTRDLLKAVMTDSRKQLQNMSLTIIPLWNPLPKEPIEIVRDTLLLVWPLRSHEGIATIP
jgi:hypothetical protein